MLNTKLWDSGLSGVFELAQPFNWLNNNCPLHFQAGVLFETLQASGAMAPWASTVNDVGLAVFGRKEFSLAELVLPLTGGTSIGPVHIATQTFVLRETLQAFSATVLWAS